MQLQYLCIQSNLLCLRPMSFIMPFINVTHLNHSAAESRNNDVTTDIRTAGDFTRAIPLITVSVMITVCRSRALTRIEWCPRVCEIDSHSPRECWSVQPQASFMGGDMGRTHNVTF